MDVIQCPLCNSPAVTYHQGRSRAYFQCPLCRLVFVHPDVFISAHEERTRYDLHRNSPADIGYRAFLSRMCDPLVSRVPAGGRGLDFGCGPGPTLSVMFEERGYPMALYDPFYATDEAVLAHEYDFVTATEVVEHFRRPLRDWDRMWRCVKPGGYLGVMTKLVGDRGASFGDWHYQDDDTHICFYSRETCEWLASRWHTAPLFEGSDVILFQKKEAAAHPAAGDGTPAA